MTPIRPIAGAQPPVDAGLSLLAIVNILLRHRWLIAIVTVLVTAVAITAAWLSRSFQVTSTFMPQVSQAGGTAGLAGLAAQFGVNVGGGAGGESLNFYAELPSSRDVLRDLAQTPVPPSAKQPADVRTVLDYVEAKGATADARLQSAVQRLQRRVTASPDLKANTVLLRTVARDPAMAEFMNARLLELINRFNMEKRQSRASNERRFTEQRMNEARHDLDAAEGALESFLSRNRMLGSPQLQFERLRLERRVQVQQEVYLSLAKAFEEARLDEVRDTPVITVIESPQGAARPAGTGRALGAILGVTIGLLLGAILAFMVDFIQRQRTADPAEWREFQALRARLLGRQVDAAARTGSG